MRLTPEGAELFCDYPAEVERTGDGEVGVAVYGPEDCPCTSRVMAPPEGVRVSVSVRADGETLEAKRRQAHREYVTKPGRSITVSWSV